MERKLKDISAQKAGRELLTDCVDDTEGYMKHSGPADVMAEYQYDDVRDGGDVKNVAPSEDAHNNTHTGCWLLTTPSV